jgi:F1F0 ATPase subunit 2
MDAKRMNVITFGSPVAWTMVAGLAAYLAAGIVLGILYFRGLWWNARLFARAGHLPTGIVLMVGRFVLLGGLLTLASLQGALPLLVMALGVFIARFAVMRRAWAAAPLTSCSPASWF